MKQEYIPLDEFPNKSNEGMLNDEGTSSSGLSTRTRSLELFDNMEESGSFPKVERKIQSLLDELAEVLFQSKQPNDLTRIRKAIAEQLQLWCQACQENADLYRSQQRKLKSRWDSQTDILSQIESTKASLAEVHKAEEISNLKTSITHLDEEIQILQEKLAIVTNQRNTLVKRLQTYDNLEKKKALSMEDRLLTLQEQYDAHANVSSLEKRMEVLKKREDLLRLMVGQALPGMQFFQRLIHQIQAVETKLISILGPTSLSEAALPPLTDVQRTSVLSLLTSTLHSLESARQIADSNTWKPIIVCLELEIVYFENMLTAITSTPVSS
ncbi:Schizosaccharomyces specific protein [Schizosaccharomyces pombe]|uniref:Uncharacterized protein C1685.04 n=1 Tax=Schizosaccharomyces pombe (strain 972 / ATCC 24843) TaxID=284812 RepID=YH04_SCHPO|nr:uncharacterized protein SPBC1685.04 [Schizosaccharomyces pombe]O74324.1 RecName: Full=Uncharacterized protein C1685.04 [Schizosaccharomyces pombe 972h-]CAA20052.1 sequence orphan [Schizosaccharomyces pombe]|eukprot:NP_595208.1 uncharacterized protein SPBC1685.04 [Schizosaccharomyces pombe]